MNELQSNIQNSDLLAKEINLIKDQTSKLMLQSSIEVGKRLKEAKELVGHGNWGDWLEQMVDYSQRTASYLIKLYEEYGESCGINSNSQALANLSYTQAVVMLKLNSDERENFLENNDIDSMSTRDLEKAIADKKAAEKESELLKEKNRKILESVDKLYGENEDLKKQIVDIEDLQKRLDELKNSGANPEKIKALEGNLEKSKKEVEKLKKQLAEKVTESEPVEIEVVPPEVAEEIEKLKTKLQMGENTVRYKATMDTIVILFENLINTVEEMKEDHEQYERYKKATNKFLEKLKIV